VDASVLVSCASRRHPFWAFATRFLGKVQHGDYEGIVSTLALMECITGVRDFLTKQGVRDTKRWEAAVKSHFEALYKMPNLKFIDGTPQNPSAKSANWPVSDILLEAFTILSSYSGKAIEDRNTRRAFPTYKYDGLYSPDALHIVLAKRSGCSRLATFDQDFIESKKEIPPIVLNVSTAW
jgi:predicted nucleic acid-binding protein